TPVMQCIRATNPTHLTFEIADRASAEGYCRELPTRPGSPLIQGDGRSPRMNCRQCLPKNGPTRHTCRKSSEHMRAAEGRRGALRLVFNYHGQIDPEIVYWILWSIQLHPWGYDSPC